MYVYIYTHMICINFNFHFTTPAYIGRFSAVLYLINWYLHCHFLYVMYYLQISLHHIIPNPCCSPHLHWFHLLWVPFPFIYSCPCLYYNTYSHQCSLISCKLHCSKFSPNRLCMRLASILSFANPLHLRSASHYHSMLCFIHKLHTVCRSLTWRSSLLLAVIIQGIPKLRSPLFFTILPKQNIDIFRSEDCNSMVKEIELFPTLFIRYIHLCCESHP